MLQLYFYADVNMFGGIFVFYKLYRILLLITFISSYDYSYKHC